jgi:hypothetical protein
MLCVAFQGIFKGELREYQYRPHHTTISDPFHAAQNKCPFCTLIWERLLLEHTDWGLLHEDLTVEESSYALLEKLVAADLIVNSCPAKRWNWDSSKDDALLKLEFITSSGHVDFTLTPNSGECWSSYSFK